MQLCSQGAGLSVSNQQFRDSPAPCTTFFSSRFLPRKRGHPTLLDCLPPATHFESPTYDSIRYASTMLPWGNSRSGVNMSIQAIPSSIWMAPPRSMQTHSRPAITSRVPSSHSMGQAIPFSAQMSHSWVPSQTLLTHSPFGGVPM